MEGHSKLAHRTKTLVAATLVLISSAAPASAVALLGEEPAPVVLAELGAAYAHQLAFLQNPVQDPGFSVGAPFWTGGSVDEGALRLEAGGSSAQDFPAATDAGTGAFGAVSPFVNAEALAFRASGNGTATLVYVEQATGQAFTVLSVTFTNANGALRFPIAPDARLAQSSPFRLTFGGNAGGATIDDVVLEGVEYGDASLPAELDDPLPRDAQTAIATLEQEVAAHNVDLDLTTLLATGDYAHDGYSLLVLPLDFTPAPGGVTGALADPATFAAHPGSWRFAVFLVEYGPSGTSIVSADSLSDARLLLNATPTLHAQGEPATPRQLLALRDTAYTDLLPFDDLDARGVVFRTNDVPLDDLNLVAVWNTPADEGGLYAEPDVRGFFHPAKLTLGETPAADALDVATLPLAAFGIGALPCAGADGLTYRFGDLDCDQYSDLAEVQCSVDTSNGLSIAPFSPDPLDASRSCLDPDGDGLIGDNDPQPQVAGALDVTIGPDANGDWWRGQRALDFTVANSYHGENTLTELDVRLAVIFQTDEDVDFDGQRVDCDAGLVITADGTVPGTCYFDASVADEGEDYRVLLIAEIIQPPHDAPIFGDELGRLIGIDKTVPLDTELDITGTPGLNGWYTTTVSVAFDTEDALSGVDHVDCALDGATLAPCASAAIEEPGTTSLSYRAVDEAGNAETTKTQDFSLSLNDPVVSCAATSSPLGDDGWHLSAFDVACTATSDTPSADISVSLDGATSAPYTAPIGIDTAGAHTLVATVVDEAGRDNEPASFAALLDLAAPATTLDIDGDLVAGSLYSSALSVGFDVDDDASGLSRTMVSVDGAAPQVVLPGGRVNLTTDGTHTLVYHSIDAAGRAEASDNKTLVIDRAAPVTVDAITGTLGANGWYRSDLVVELVSTDDASGVNEIRYRLDGSANQTYVSGIDVSGDGEHALVYFGVDNAGNAENETNLSLDIDATPPDVSLSFNGTQGLGGWFLGDVVGTVSATDGVSGVNDVLYLVGNSGYQPYTGPFTITAQGLTAVAAYATDDAGNAAPVQGAQIKIDSVDPVTTVSLSGAEVANNWFNGPVQVTLSAADAVSGISRIEYNLDDAGFVLYTGPFNVSGERAHELRTRAFDVAGNAENDPLTLVKIDTVDPNATTLAINGTLGGDGWYTSATMLTFTPSDATSGIDVLRVSLDGGITYTPYTGAGPHEIELDTSGTYALAWQARDLSGRTEAARSDSVKLDLVAPTTTADLDGISAVAPWINVAPATLTLSAVDPDVPTGGSGVDLVEYRIDNGTWTPYAGAVNFSTDGVFFVEYRASDNAGNVEATKELLVHVDTTAPTVTRALAGVQGVSPWYTSSVVVHLNASDATSGPVSILYTIGNTSFTGGQNTISLLGAQGENIVFFRGVDAAGNVGPEENVTFQIDALTPTTNASLGGTLGANGIYTSAVGVTLSDVHGPSGATTEYRVGEGAAQPYNGTFTISGQGTTLVRFRSTSGAGLVEAWKERTLRIDLEDPVTTASLSGDNVSSEYYRSNVTVNLTPSDSYTQIASTVYSTDGATFQAYTEPFLVSALGSTIVSFRSTDESGREEATKSVQVLVDWSAPVTSATLVGTQGNAPWFKGPVNVTLSATTGPSGFHSTRYALDGGELQAYAPFQLATDAVHEVAFTSRSNADVNETPKTIAVSIDATVPFTTLVATGDQVDPDYYTSPVTLNLTAIDNRSGVGLVEFRVNGGAWQAHEGNVTTTINGAILFEYRATDVAGNVEPTRSFSFFVDYDVPVSNLSLAGSLGANGWYVSNVTATLSATPGPSGLDRIEWRDNGGSYATYAGPLDVGANGQHAFQHRAISNAGLVEDDRNASFKIDTVAPVTSIALAGDLGTNGFYTSAVDVTLSVVETTSGLNLTRYRLDGGAWTPYTGAIEVGTSGTHTILVESRDHAGNVETAHDLTFKIDVDDIVTTIVATGTEGDEGWFIGPVTITLTADGGPSNISLTEVSVDSGPFVDYAGTPFNLTADGERTIDARSTNGAGVVESPAKTLGVNIDQLAPVTTHTLTPVNGLNGWHVGNVVFSLNATDATSGVRTLQYRHNGGEWLNSTLSTFTITLGGDGYHLVEYRAIDHAGLVESIKSFQFKIDTGAPQTSATPTGVEGANGWYVSAVDLDLAATSGPSNLTGIYYSVNGGPTLLYGGVLSFAEGVHNVTFNATSGAGVNETPQSILLRVDTTDPATSIGLGGAQSAGWYFEPVTVFVNASDATSGLATTECSVDGSAFAACAASFVVTKQGLSTFAVRSTDNASNVEAEHNVSFSIDTLGPITTVETNGTIVRPPWFTTNVDVSASASDPTPGSGNITLYRDGAANGTPFTIATDGTFTHAFHAVDAAGNIGPTIDLTVRIDRVVPTTSATIDALGGNGGWVRSVPTITLTNATGPSGAFATTVALDGGSAGAYAGAFTVPGEGYHNVTFATESVAGILEATKTLPLKVDTVAPTVTLDLDGTEGANGWFTTNVTITLLPSDATSGVASCEINIVDGASMTGESFTFIAEGIHEVTYRCTDVAGNVGALQSATIKIDKVDPTISGAITAGAVGLAGYYVSNVTVSFTTVEATSGVARILVSKNGAAFTPVSSPHTIGDQGETTLAYRVEDNAGRVSSDGSLSFKIDSLLPAVGITLAGDLGDNGWYTSAVVANVTASDAGSGVVARTYSLDGSANFSCGCPVTVSSSGEHTLNATATDAAGNLGTKLDVRVKIDSAAPTTVANVTGTLGQDQWFTSPVTIAFTASDDLSQVRHILVSIDNADYEPANGSVTIDTDGAHVVRFRAQDFAGNLEAVQERSFNVDTTAPTLTVATSGTPGNAGWTRSAVTVTLNASDATSGTSQIRYRLNEGNELTYSGPFQIAAEGQTELRYRAIDVAGISSAVSNTTLRIDTQAPTVANATSGTMGTNGWFRSVPSVTLAASDPAPGSGPLPPTYTVDGGAPTSYTGAFDVAGEGAHLVTYASSDVAGNAGTTRTLALKVDTVKPLVIIAATPLDGSIHTGDVSVVITSSDATSTLASTEYSFDNATWTPYTGAVVVTTTGLHTVFGRATDKAGHVSDIKSVSFAIDKVEPTLDLAPYRASVGTATPSVTATFGPVFAGWNASRTTLFVDGVAAPRCAAAGSTGTLVVSCTPVSWLEAFASGGHTVVACATTNANKVWCSDDLLTRTSRLPWTFTVNADDWDRDTHLNNRESRYGSLPYNPYSVPYDPQGWNLRTTPNDPESPLVASDSQNLSQAQSFVKLRFAQFEYASPQNASFAPNRTAVLSSLERIAIMELNVTTTPSIAVRAGANESASVTLGESNTTIRVGTLAPIEIPARAVVTYETGPTTGTLGLTIRALGQTYAEIGLDEGADLTAVLYGPGGAPVARFPPADADGDLFLDDLEAAFVSDPLDANDTPVPRSDTADDYAVVMKPIGPAAPVASVLPNGVSPPVALFSSGGSFPVLVHVDDFQAGARVPLEGKRIRFALLPLDAAEAFLPGAPGGSGVYDTSLLSPAGRDPTPFADWSTTCVIGDDCDAVIPEPGGDGTRVIVNIPSNRAALGPYVLWVHLDVDDRAGIDSASGFYAAPKAALHDAPVENDETMLVEEEQDYTATPVIFVTIPKGDALGEDGDGDGFTTAQEIGIDGSAGSGSDPFDDTSTPNTDDDGDGCLNRDEAIPSWILATPDDECSAPPSWQVG